MEFQLILTRKFSDTDYFADSMVNDVGEVPVDITDEEATSAVRDEYMAGYIDALDLLNPEHTDWSVEVIKPPFVPMDNGTELTLHVTIGDDAPKIEVGNGYEIAPLSMLHLYPMSVNLTAEGALRWAAMLRVIADQCEQLTELIEPQVCFPTAGMEA